MINLRILDKYRVQQQQGMSLTWLWHKHFQNYNLTTQLSFYTVALWSASTIDATPTLVTLHILHNHKKEASSPGSSLLLSSRSVLVTGASSRPFLTSYYSVPQTRKKCVLTIQTVDFYRNIYIHNLDTYIYAQESFNTALTQCVPASFLLTKSFLHTWRSI